MSNNKKAPRLSGKAKNELKMLPGYVIIIAWVMFTFILLGWVLCASLSTTPEIFAGEVGKFPTGLHFENFAKAWSSQNVSVIFGKNDGTFGATDIKSEILHIHPP